MQEGLLALVGRGKRKNKDWTYQSWPCAFSYGPANSPQSAATGGRGGGHRWLELYLLSPIRSHRAQLALFLQTSKASDAVALPAVQSSPCQ